jgi:hypothetical protein
MKAARFALAALSFAAIAAHAMTPTCPVSSPTAPPAPRPAPGGSGTGRIPSGRREPLVHVVQPAEVVQSERSRAEVQAEYLASRNAVAAMTAEDSGSAYLAARKPATEASRQLAGQPVNAQ